MAPGSSGKRLLQDQETSVCSQKTMPFDDLYNSFKRTLELMRQLLKLVKLAFIQSSWSCDFL